jgi:ethanolamine utilization protein EutN
MRIAEIIGRCTLSACHPSLRGAKWVIGVPLAQEGIQNVVAGKSEQKDAGRNEAFVIYDDLGAGQGDLIAVSEGAEAAAPFGPNLKPIDAYAAAILDRVEITG